MQFDNMLEIITPDLTNVLTIGGTAIELPSGSTESRPLDAVAGAIRYNTTTGKLELCTATTEWAATATTVIISSSNGFAGTVDTSTATPVITLSTSVSGLIKGNGTTLSSATVGADYSLGTAGLATGILKTTTGSGSLSTAVAADFPILNQDTTGNAATTTQLQTARTINGVSFDGTQNITVTADAGTLTGTALNSTVVSSSLTSVGTLSALTVSGTSSLATVTTSGDATVNGQTTTVIDLVVNGNFTVNGTTTTINSTSLEVADLYVTVAKNATSALEADGAGLIVNGANATILYEYTDDSWNLNRKVSATSFYGAGTGLTGTAAGLNIGGNAGSATKLETARTINGVSFDGTSDILVPTTSLNVSTQTTNYTAVSSDGLILANAAITVTLPAASSFTNRTFTIKRISDAGPVYVASNGGLIDDETQIQITAKYASISVVSDGTNWWII